MYGYHSAFPLPNRGRREQSSPSWKQYDLLMSGDAEEAFKNIQGAAERLDATFACGGTAICSQPIKIIFGDGGGAPKV